METILNIADETVSAIYNTKESTAMIYININDLMDCSDCLIPTIISIFKGNLKVEIINYEDNKAIISLNKKYFIITISNDKICINIYDNYLDARRFYRWF